MKFRKGSILALTALVTGLGLAGITLAESFRDEKLHKAMEDVKVKNALISKNIRNEAAFKKSKKDVVDAAKALTKIGKDFREADVADKTGKKNPAAWTAFMDAYIKETEKFAEDTAKPEAKQADVKKAYANVSGTCTKCHEVYREDE